MQRFIAASIVLLFGIWLGQPALSSVLDVNQAPIAAESAGEPDIPLEDTSSQQQSFDEEEEEEKIFTTDMTFQSRSFEYLYYSHYLNSESDVLLDITLPPPELV